MQLYFLSSKNHSIEKYINLHFKKNSASHMQNKVILPSVELTGADIIVLSKTKEISYIIDQKVPLRYGTLSTM